MVLNEIDDSVMRLMAENIVNNLHCSKYDYRPRRGAGNTSLGWTSRLGNYQWSGSDFRETENIVSNFCNELNCIVPDVLDLPASGDMPEQLSLILRDVTSRIFRWGGVTRGHGNLQSADIANVIKSAIQYDCVGGAPMDSAWTKLAAFASAGNAGKPPQVIFDSRVAISLLEQIDYAVAKESSLAGLRERLRIAGLGFVEGRGGNRPARAQALRRNGWRNRYRSWAAQFVASRVVHQIVGVLNDDFPCEPTAGSATNGPWTTRRVEMVLFMDGY